MLRGSSSGSSDAKWWIGALVALGLATGACGGHSRSGESKGPGGTAGDATSMGGNSSPTGGKGAAPSGGKETSSGGTGNASGGGKASGGNAATSGGSAAAGQMGKAGSATSAGSGTGPGSGGTPASEGGKSPSSGGKASTAGEGGTSPSTGGAAPIGGSAGGTSIPEPEVGTVGTECSPPGALQCADTHQRVIVVCGGDGTWEAFETCPVGQFCDTRQGASLGSCQDPYPDCVDQEPGYRFCKDNAVYECGPDTIATHLVEACELACLEAKCTTDQSCPAGTNWVNCSQDCPQVEYGCGPDDTFAGTTGSCPAYANTVEWSSIKAIRLPAASEMCECENGMRSFAINNLDTSSALKMTIDPPWVISKYVLNARCASPVGSQCYYAPVAAVRHTLISTDDPDAPSVNLYVEPWSGTKQEACPCLDESCADDEVCPTGTHWVDCSADCTGVTCSMEEPTPGNPCPAYYAAKNWSELDTIRIPGASEACECDNGIRMFHIVESNDGFDDGLKLTVNPPWWIARFERKMPSGALADPCAVSAGSTCYYAAAQDKQTPFREFIIGTDDPNAGSRNVQIKYWRGTEAEACP
ncbi:MAG: hypothetical protein JW940_12120 [Polyangiaceae bacterium]|nr:hypothetical protein [Polyangiaceae bacterium]